MPRFDADGCRIVGAEADSLELAQTFNDDLQLDELRVEYERQWGFPANTDLRICWVGVYHANGKLVAAMGYTFQNDTQKLVVTDLLSSGTRWGKVGTYLLANWLQRMCKKGTKVLGQCDARNIQHRKFLELFGGKIVTVLYLKEF